MVKVRNLRKRFGDIEALSGIDLTVDKGIIFALVGPDGAGKTTLLRSLAGILTPDEGRIEILGCDVVNDPESVKDKIGYLSQRFSLSPVLTVAENIDFFGTLYSVPSSKREPRVKRLLEFSRLGPFKKRQARHLSGGMKKKLALCCSLIHTPELLLLDEPTTGVDPISRRELWAILYDLLREGVTIIVTTPYMEEAERAGEIMLLHNGQAIMTGPPEKLKSAYKFSLFEVVCDNCRFAHKLASERLGKERVVFFGDKLHFALDRPGDSDGIRSYLEDSGVVIRSMTGIAPGLEDLFIQEISVEG